MQTVDEVSDDYITVVGQLCGASELVKIAVVSENTAREWDGGGRDKLYLLFVRIFLAVNLWKAAA